MKLFNCKVCLAAMVAMTMASAVRASEVNDAKSSLGILNAVTSAELPAKAAELVAQANGKNLKPTTVSVVKAAVGLNPAAAPAVVGCIAQTSPVMAATAAATAVSLVPNQVLLISRAAAVAVPAKAGEIVEAVCRVMPAAYQKIAEVVADVVPGAGKDILAGVVAALPELKNSITQVVAGYSGVIPSVGTVLAQVAQTQSTTTLASSNSGLPVGSAGGTTIGTPVLPLPQGPSAKPPQVPIVTNPVLYPTNGTSVPPSGNNYSAP